jgi:hypothetical protein
MIFHLIRQDISLIFIHGLMQRRNIQVVSSFLLLTLFFPAYIDGVYFFV